MIASPCQAFNHSLWPTNKEKKFLPLTILNIHFPQDSPTPCFIFFGSSIFFFRLMINMSRRGDEKVVVILTSTCASWSGIKWVVNALSLSPGDELILLGILSLTDPARTLSMLTAAAQIWGHKGKEDPNKIFGSNRRVTEEDVRRKKEEFHKNAGLLQLQKLYEVDNKVKVSVEVEAGLSRKGEAVRVIKRLGATWVILDREMKRDKQYFMDRLSCGISSMKSNNTLVKLRGPIHEHVSYDEMIPSYSFEDLSPSNIGNTKSSKQPIPKKKSHSQSQKSPTNDQNLHQLLNIGDNNGIQMEEFQNPICTVCKNRRPKIGMQRDFTYKELYEATKGFSRRNFLSEGGFGFVFKGKLKDGLQIAVKQHKPASLQGEKEFKSEVHVLSQARHQNVVLLLGSCAEGSHRLLVYEYVCDGSLDEHLLDDGSRQPLNWEQRIKIAMGAAKGLAYLHARNIVHRDMRPSNILITHDHESMLGDFGLAKAQEGDTLTSSGVVGTLGYVAPEYAESGKMSTKTDVYSFGVVLLQLITGLKTTDEILGGKGLVGWAKPLLETKNYPDLSDKRILDSHDDVHKLFWMVLVAEKCLKEDPDNRWTMEQVVHNLNCMKEGNTNFIIDFAPTQWDSALNPDSN